MRIPTFGVGCLTLFPLPRSGYRVTSKAMDCSEGARQMLEDLWRDRFEAAELRYVANPSTENRAAYLSELKTFADLVLRGEAPDLHQRT